MAACRFGSAIAASVFIAQYLSLAPFGTIQLPCLRMPLAMEWNGGILKQGSWVVPKGAKDQYWAMKCWR